jgi:peptidoglycan hydrolase CwlO-like protein
MRRATQNLTADLADLQAQIARLTEAVESLDKKLSEPPRASYTFAEIQKRHKLSESQFFKLLREGHGPAVMSTGDVGKRVSAEAEADWIADREEAAKAEAAAAKAAAAEAADTTPKRRRPRTVTTSGGAEPQGP